MLDITYCASECGRIECFRHKTNAPIESQWVWWADMSVLCADFSPIQDEPDEIESEVAKPCSEFDINECSCGRRIY